MKRLRITSLTTAVLGAACMFAGAAACGVDIISEDGTGGSAGGVEVGGGPGAGGEDMTGTGVGGSPTGTATGSGQGGSPAGSATGTQTGAVQCLGQSEADCLAAPNCVPLMRNDVTLPGTPPPPDNNFDPDLVQPCCWGCGEPTCVSCHQPVFQGCIDGTYCDTMLPDNVCGYIQDGDCP